MNRIKLNFALFLDQLAFCLLIWGYAAGALLLVGKVTQLPPERLSLLCSVSLPIPFLIALVLYYPKRYSESFLRAWLDLHNQAGGRLLRTGDLPAEELRSLSVHPAVRLWPLLRRLLLPLAFFVGAWFVPPPSPDGAGGSGKGLTRKVDALQRKAAEFVEVGALPRPLEKQVLDQLERVKKAAEVNPEGAAESLNVLEQKLERSVLMRISAGLQSEEKTRQAARKTQGGEGAAEELAQMLAALENQQTAEGGELPEEVQKALQQVMQKLGVDSLAQRKGLPNLARMNPEDLRKLLEALKNCNKKNAGAGKSCQSLMSSAEAAEALRKMLQGSPSLSGQDLRLDGLGEGDSEEFGNGGVSRGRGDAKLSFGNEADGTDARFKPAELPKADNILPGVTLAQERERPGEQTPPEEFRTVVRTGALVRSSVNAGESGTVLSPARAQAAQEYFEQLSKPASP